MPRTLVLLMVFVLVGDLSAQRAPNKRKVLKEPIPGYKHQKIEGFDVLVHEAVIEHNDDAEYKRKPLDVLELELSTITGILPPKAVDVLRKLVIWVEWHDEEDPDLQRGAIAKYYYTSGNRSLWSLRKGKHPLKANNVEIINMKSLTEEHQPGVKFERCVILHELAHAVHFHIYGGENPNIKATYAQAMQRQLYDKSKDVYGRTITPYAAKSDAEYFAELSCAYLDKLHYFPHTRDDLKKHDPVGYELMEQLWGKAEIIDRGVAKAAEKAANKQMQTIYKLIRVNTKPAHDKAREMLNEVIERYPNTESAKIAQQILDRGKKED